MRLALNCLTHLSSSYLARLHICVATALQTKERIEGLRSKNKKQNRVYCKVQKNIASLRRAGIMI